MASDVRIDFDGQLDGLRDELRDMQGTINTWGQNISAVGVAAFGAWAATKAFDVIKDGLTSAIGLAREFAALAQVQVDAETKLAAVIKATGGAAGFTADEMKKMAAGLQSITTFGDEAIINMQALLATFKEVKGDQFTEATRAALDMAAVLDTDLKGAAIQLGKALNDPTQGMNALTRSGVSFTEQQKQLVKALQESGNIAGAQNVILAEMRAQFGGAAEAAAAAAGGGMKQFWNTLGDIKESIGMEVLPLLDDMAPALEFLVVEAGKLGKTFIDMGRDLADSVLGIDESFESFSENIVGALAHITSVLRTEVQEWKVINKSFQQANLEVMTGMRMALGFDTRPTVAALKQVREELAALEADLGSMPLPQVAAREAVDKFRAFQTNKDLERGFAQGGGGLGGSPAPTIQLPSLADLGKNLLDSPAIQELKKLGESVFENTAGTLGRAAAQVGAAIKDQFTGAGGEAEPAEGFQSSIESLSGLFQRIQTGAASSDPEERRAQQQLTAIESTRDATTQSKTLLERIQTGIQDLVQGKGGAAVAVLGE
jgi:hypothetical protein